MMLALVEKKLLRPYPGGAQCRLWNCLGGIMEPESEGKETTMRRRIGILALLLAALLAFVVGGCARWRPHTPEERADRMVEHLAEKLDLSPEQRLQLEQIKVEVLARQAEMLAHREESFDEILAMMQSERIDDTRMKIAVADHQARANELIAFAGEKLKEFHDMLTPEQRAKVVAALQDFRENGHRRCGWH